MSDISIPKPIRASRVTLSQLMHPEHANLLGNVHGGWIMKLVDEAGALACMRHAQKKVVTVAIDSMTFREPTTAPPWDPDPECTSPASESTSPGTTTNAAGSLPS